MQLNDQFDLKHCSLWQNVCYYRVRFFIPLESWHWQNCKIEKNEKNFQLKTCLFFSRINHFWRSATRSRIRDRVRDVRRRAAVRQNFGIRRRSQSSPLLVVSQLKDRNPGKLFGDRPPDDSIGLEHDWVLIFCQKSYYLLVLARTYHRLFSCEWRQINHLQLEIEGFISRRVELSRAEFLRGKLSSKTWPRVSSLKINLKLK